MIRGQPEERGFALILGLTVLVILTILGLSVMSTVGEDLTAVKNMRQSEDALAIAEAGVSWAIEQLNKVSPLGYGLEASKQYDSLLQDASNLNLYTALTAGDEICTGMSDAQCTNWRQIGTTAFGSGGTTGSTQGTFRVAYGDDEDGDGDFGADDNDTIVIRSIGTDSLGSKRMIEVVVTAGSP
ncbi:MAG: PilX N-terminal domain-containing pilus assembly protein [Myxococcota bacterium]